VAAVVCLCTLAAACDSDDEGTASTGTTGATTTTEDPVAAAEGRVAAAETALSEAEEAQAAAREQFCGDATTYVEAIDRYGKLFNDDDATVGDVKTGGADLAEPQEAVASAADAVSAARSDVASAQAELAAAQAELATAQAGASGASTSSTTPSESTTTTLVPAATVTRVQQAEEELATTAEGITDATPLSRATVEFNSAAFALEIAWLKLLADAGCFSEEQQSQAVAQVTEYTITLQTQLQQAGYYQGPIDGIYGPLTVDAVKQLQADSDLPTTGVVDQATARALDEKLAELGEQGAAQARTQTAAVQTMLTLTGFWTGPIDGEWSDELTVALMNFQTELGVEPTGGIDAATLAGIQQALAALDSSPPTTTTTIGTSASTPTTEATTTT
jgi:peptidoglycan hydrolase-like protein with peptidoglycan-binding domain